MQSRTRTEAACLAAAARDLALNEAMIALIENHQRKMNEAFARIDALNKEKSNA